MRERLLWGLALVLAVVLSRPAVSGEPGGLLERAMEGEATWVDLTHPLDEKTVRPPGGVPFKKVMLADYPDGFRLHRFEMGENVGTHVNAPAHFFQGKTTVDRIPLGRLVGPAAVVDASAQVRRSPDYRLRVEDLLAWERDHGRIPTGAIVLMSTGWWRRAGDPGRYRNADKDKVMHFPGFSKAAAEFLVGERRVSGVGIDTLSLDHGPSKDFPVHRVMLAADKFQVENLTALDKLPPVGAFVFALPLRVKDGTQAGARVVALVP